VGLALKGGTLEEQLGSDGFETIHPDDIQKCKNIYQSAYDECRHFQIEYRLKDAGGEYRWILETGIPQFSPAGDLLGYIGTCFDITDEKQHLSKEIVKGKSQPKPIAKILQDNFEFNRYLFDQCPVGLALCRLDGTLVEVNPAFASIIGYTVSETLNLSYWQITHEKYGAQEHIQLENLEKNGRYGPYEKEYIHKDGHLVPVQLQGTLVEIEGERLIWSSIAEISTSKQTDAELWENYSLLQTVIEGTPDVIFVKDARGGHVTVNSAFTKLFGKSKEEIIGKDDSALFPPELVDQVRETDRKIMTSGEAQTIEEVVPINGIPRTYLTTKSVWRDREGNALGLVGIARDISSRKQAEEALRLSEKRLKLALEAADNGVWDWNITTGEAYFSPQFQQMIGYKVGELEANVNSWVNLLHPEDQRKVQEALNLHLEGRTSAYQTEFRMRRKSGDWQWIFSTGKIVERDETGKPLRMLGTHQDISERKQAEKEQQNLIALIESSYDFVGISNLSGEATYLNEAGQKMLGIESLEQVKNTKILEYFFPEDRAYVLEQILPMVMEQGRWEGEVQFRHFKTGAAIPVIWNVFALKDPQTGEVYGLATVTRDISERKALEEELARRQARFDAFFNAAPAGMVILDEQLRYVHLNETLAEMNGVPVADSVGKTLREVLPDIAPTLETTFHRIMATGHPLLNIELSGETPKQPGVKRHWMTSYFPLPGPDGAVLGVGGVVVEITEHKRAEEALREYQEKLEELVAERTAELSTANEQLQQQVHDRLLTEATLRESEERFRVTFDNAAVGIADAGLDGSFLRVNPKFCQILGYTHQEILALKYLEITHPDDFEADIKAMQSVLSGEKQTHLLEKRYIRKDGSPVWVNLTVSMVRDAAGEPKYMIGVIEDISTRKALEKELALRQARFDAFFTTAPAGLCIFDDQLRYVQINETLADFIGMPVAECLGRNIWEIIPELAPTLEPIYRRILATGEPVTNIEIAGETQKHPGVIRHWINSYFPLPSPDGTALGLGIVVIEITDRKRAEAEIQQSYNLLHSVMESTPDLVFVKDREGRYAMLNTPATHVLGKSVEEVVGKTDADIMPAAAALQLRENDLRIMNRGVTEIVEEPVQINDQIITYLSAKSPWRDLEGNVLGIIGLSRDISERKQVEDALVRSEQALRQQAMREKLLNRLAGQIRNSLDLDTILETALQEIRNLLQIDWCTFNWVRLQSSPSVWETVHEAKNPALRSLLGSYPLESMNLILSQIMQRKIIWADNIRTIDDPQVQATYLFLGINSSLSLPIQGQSCQDIGVIVCNHTQPRHWQDEEVELLKAIADQLAIAMDQARLYEQSRTKAHELEQALHQLQRTQTQLIQSEKMSSLGQLVAGVAHEINNPVNFIYGNLTHANEYTQDLLNLLQIYQNTYPQPTLEIQEEIEAIELDFLQEDLPKLLSSMKIGADRIREIVLSLRTFSRLDESEMKEVDIHEGIESTLLILANRLKAKSERRPIEIIREYGNLPLVECYAGALNQVFMNILTNAIDALEEQHKPHSIEEIKANSSQITIHTEFIDRSSANELAFVRIAISDNGPGMSEQVRSKLFDPFFTTKPIGSGTGLGLSISYQITVEKHRGNLRCVSGPGAGAEFIIEIPVKQPL
jgi:PAS domain S-box-containing protein